MNPTDVYQLLAFTLLSAIALTACTIIVCGVMHRRKRHDLWGRLFKFVKATDSLWFRLYWSKTNQVRGR